MRNVMLLCGIIACLATLSLAGFDAHAGDESRIATYRCQGGHGFEVVYSDDGGAALLILGKMTYRLSRVSSGSGATYVSRQATLRFQGKTAYVEINGKPVLNNCRLAHKPK